MAEPPYQENDGTTVTNSTYGFSEHSFDQGNNLSPISSTGSNSGRIAVEPPPGKLPNGALLPEPNDIIGSSSSGSSSSSTIPSSSSPGSCMLPVERSSFKPRIKTKFDLCDKTILAPECPAFSINLNLMADPPSYTIINESGTDNKGITLEINGKEIKGALFPYIGRAVPDDTDRTNIVIKYNGKVCHSETISFDPNQTPECPAFSINVNLKGEAPRYIINKLDNSKDTTGITIEVNGKALTESITFPHEDIMNELDEDTIIEIKFYGKVCHSETISSDTLKGLKAAAGEAGEGEKGDKSGEIVSANTSHWNPRMHIIPFRHKIKINFEGPVEYSYKLSIVAVDDASNSQTIPIPNIDNSYNETHHTIVARNLTPNTLYSLFIIGEVGNKELLRSNEISIKTKVLIEGEGEAHKEGRSDADADADADANPNPNADNNNSGSEVNNSQSNNGETQYDKDDQDGQDDQDDQDDQLAQANAPGPFIRFSNKSVFSLDEAGKSSVSDGSPGILRMDEFKERFLAAGQDLKNVRENIILYWFIPSLYGKDFTPISNPATNEYRAPCNKTHRDLLKSSFEHYVEFLKRNGADKPERTSEEDSYAIELEKINLYLTELNKNPPQNCITEGEAKSKMAFSGNQGGKGNYYKFLPDMFYLAYMQAKEGGKASSLNADEIFSKYSEISGMSVDKILDELKKDKSGVDEFDHNIGAGVLRILTFLQEKYPTVYKNIIKKSGSPEKPLALQSGGGARNVSHIRNAFEPLVNQQRAWHMLNRDYNSLTPEHKAFLPPPPRSPIIETVEPFTKYIDENADNETLNEARGAVDLLAPDDLEELMRSDADTSPMSRIKPYYEKALPGIGTPWVPIMVRADILSRVLKNRT